MAKRWSFKTCNDVDDNNIMGTLFNRISSGNGYIIPVYQTGIYTPFKSFETRDDDVCYLISNLTPEEFVVHHIVSKATLANFKHSALGSVESITSYELESLEDDYLLLDLMFDEVILVTYEELMIYYSILRLFNINPQISYSPCRDSEGYYFKLFNIDHRGIQIGINHKITYDPKGSMNYMGKMLAMMEGMRLGELEVLDKYTSKLEEYARTKPKQEPKVEQVKPTRTRWYHKVISKIRRVI